MMLWYEKLIHCFLVTGVLFLNVYTHVDYVVRMIATLKVIRVNSNGDGTAVRSF